MLLPQSRSPTPLFALRLKPLFVRTFATLTVCMSLISCATLTKPSPDGPSPLVIASCPELTPLTDASFGATTSKLVEVGGLYRECREAALAGKQPTK